MIHLTIPLIKYLGIDAIVIYPFLITEIKNPNKFLMNHERIHFDQIKRDGVIGFYLSYVLEYLTYRVRGMNHREAYFQISYEIEAYENQFNLDYEVK